MEGVCSQGRGEGSGLLEAGASAGRAGEGGSEDCQCRGGRGPRIVVVTSSRRFSSALRALSPKRRSAISRVRASGLSPGQLEPVISALKKSARGQAAPRLGAVRSWLTPAFFLQCLDDDSNIERKTGAQKSVDIFRLRCASASEIDHNSASAFLRTLRLAVSSSLLPPRTQALDQASHPSPSGFLGSVPAFGSLRAQGTFLIWSRGFRSPPLRNHPRCSFFPDDNHTSMHSSR